MLLHDAEMLTVLFLLCHGVATMFTASGVDHCAKVHVCASGSCRISYGEC